VTETISRRELEEAIRAGGVVVVEALGRSHYDRGHIPGAVNIPHDRVEELAPRLLPDRGAQIVTYCSDTACRNSGIARSRLLAMGYSDVRAYADGKEDWEAAGLPLEAAARGEAT
jgi:rhodanese-related sulfurtransferase